MCRQWDFLRRNAHELAGTLELDCSSKIVSTDGYWESPREMMIETVEGYHSFIHQILIGKVFTESQAQWCLGGGNTVMGEGVGSLLKWSLYPDQWVG